MYYIIELDIAFSPKNKSISLLNESMNSINLSNQGNRLLLEMVTNPNIPLNREHLLKRVWEEHGFTSSNNSLNVAVSEIRKALSLLGKDPKVISTIPKEGFIFNGRVEPAINILEQTKNESFEEKKCVSKVTKINATITIVVVVLLLLLISFDAFYNTRKTNNKLIISMSNYSFTFKEAQCTIYVLKNNSKQKLEEIKRKLSGIMNDCNTNESNIYYTEIGSNNIKPTIFMAKCSLKNSENSNCVTIKTI